jgi:hypothetical protein
MALRCESATRRPSARALDRETAREAAEEKGDYDNRIGKVEADLLLLKGMLSSISR